MIKPEISYFDNLSDVAYEIMRVLCVSCKTLEEVKTVIESRLMDETITMAYIYNEINEKVVFYLD